MLIRSPILSPLPETAKAFREKSALFFSILLRFWIQKPNFTATQAVRRDGQEHFYQGGPQLPETSPIHPQE